MSESAVSALEHDADSPAYISLVIPAWNESKLLPRLLDTVNVARQAFRGGADRIEVIVADNGSTDDTAEIAAARGCRVAPVSLRCIAAARNGGARIARGEIIAFADADLRIAPNTFNFIADCMGRDDFVGGATGLVMERWSPGIVVVWYLIMPPLWLLGLDGGVWFCRLADFQSLGGFNETVRAGEDVRFLTALKRLGRSRTPRQRMVSRFSARRRGLQPPLAINSTRKFDKHGDWHMLRDAVTGLPALLFRRGTVDRYIDQYWYQDR